MCGSFYVCMINNRHAQCPSHLLPGGHRRFTHSWKNAPPVAVLYICNASAMHACACMLLPGPNPPTCRQEVVGLFIDGVDHLQHLTP